MKDLIKMGLFSLLLAAPAYAQPAAKSMDSTNCPAAAQMGDMQKSMGALLNDSDGMMKMMKDPAQLVRMQKMHDQMGVMMVNMSQMNGGMMNGGMMQGGKPATPPDASDDHGARQPEK